MFAILMLGLSPLMYLALLAVPVWLVHLPIGHAHGHFSFLSARIGFGMRPWLFRTMYLQLLLYLLLLLIELALLLAVLRPLFALRRTAVGGVAINSELEPTFCSFVAGICEWMGVAPPKRLEVDCGLNASVHLAPGRWSFFRKDLTLRIGLPVIGALSGRELAGVIAHELGHFRQRTGVRLSFLIRGTNRWLTRAVNDRDALDLWLEREGHDAAADGI